MTIVTLILWMMVASRVYALSLYASPEHIHRNWGTITLSSFMSSVDLRESMPHLAILFSDSRWQLREELIFIDFKGSRLTDLFAICWSHPHLHSIFLNGDMLVAHASSFASLLDRETEPAPQHFCQNYQGIIFDNELNMGLYPYFGTISPLHQARLGERLLQDYFGTTKSLMEKDNFLDFRLIDVLTRDGGRHFSPEIQYVALIKMVIRHCMGVLKAGAIQNKAHAILHQNSLLAEHMTDAKVKYLIDLIFVHMKDDRLIEQGDLAIHLVIATRKFISLNACYALLDEIVGRVGVENMPQLSTYVLLNALNRIHDRLPSTITLDPVFNLPKLFWTMLGWRCKWLGRVYFREGVTSRIIKWRHYLRQGNDLLPIDFGSYQMEMDVMALQKYLSLVPLDSFKNDLQRTVYIRSPTTTITCHDLLCLIDVYLAVHGASMTTTKRESPIRVPFVTENYSMDAITALMKACIWKYTWLGSGLWQCPIHEKFITSLLLYSREELTMEGRDTLLFQRLVYPFYPLSLVVAQATRCVLAVVDVMIQSDFHRYFRGRSSLSHDKEM